MEYLINIGKLANRYWPQLPQEYKDHLSALAYAIINRDSVTTDQIAFADEILDAIERENPKYQEMLRDALSEVES